MDHFFKDLTACVRFALKEDLGHADLTADLIDPQTQAHARIICREEAIVCGRPWFDEVFKQLDPALQINWHCEEGDAVKADQLLCEILGNARKILTGERTALNFLQTLSATATVTARYVAELNGQKTRLLDTRKTLPGLRLAQKYAVNCGGGQNHRFGLYDAILIKENHIMACGNLTQAVTRAKQQHPGVSVEVETENLAEVELAVAAQADIIMLDNFSIDMIKQAIQLVAGRAKLEASGNVEIAQLKTLASTGVDFISTGAITKHIQAVDLSMRFEFI
ncbi:MAG: carboxylating nicotinate-nucleotide diphosphorylase [Thiomicrospira sp.]|uniref:carboxylating nicotinate-nucleotide diphosphorylase n=1 Tax=Thiomicrospira sp. TaxID=935 RepID=UPI0019EECB44|nr:carboxylating nicotinate-nucleotide diphosphorylase [Thiomicrospira sp.]MBE0494096.1 carboxylating nicotinate-nucleotide diphosphorylase [Thiomicrospira sp.]